ncbi:heavy metal transporter [Holotrichia oblita]|nr:heavy metal transporter [Holotrichia oblita]
MDIVELKNVCFSYNKGTDEQIDAVKNLSLTVREGEFVALVGHNGSGKSTVAKLLNGLVLPDSGSVTVDGKSTDDKKDLFGIRSVLGVVFQNPDNQMVATIIEDDVAFGPENLGLKSGEIRQRVDWALKCVGMYDHREGTPHRLSGGQKQRVAIAGVLAIKPKVMVLDEATSMLDPIGRDEVIKVITRLNKEEKMTVIMITHFMNEAALADRIIVMNDGEILLDGGQEVFKEEEKIRKAGLRLPMPAEVASALNAKGLDLPRGLVTIQQLADELCRKE